MRARESRILVALLGVSLWGAACAQVGRPPGGPRDTQPPILRSSEPGSLAVAVDRNAPLRFAFSEKVNRRGIRRSLDLIPDVELENPGFEDTTVVFRPRRGWPPDSVVVWRLEAGLQDRHGVAMETAREGAFTTADALPPGRIEGRVTGPDTVTVDVEKVRARLEIPPPEDSRRGTLWRRSGADGSGSFRLEWLELPSGPFDLEVFVDANGDGRRNERERVARRDSLTLAESDTVLSVGELVLLDLEGPVDMVFCVADSSDSLLSWWASTFRTAQMDSASLDTTGTIIADSVATAAITGVDSLVAVADSTRGAAPDSTAESRPQPRLQIWSAREGDLDDAERAVADSAGCARIARVPGEWTWGAWWDENGNDELDAREDGSELLLFGRPFTVEPEAPDTLRIGADWESLSLAPWDTLSTPVFPEGFRAEPDSS